MNRHLPPTFVSILKNLTPTGAKQVCIVCTLNDESGHLQLEPTSFMLAWRIRVQKLASAYDG
jgi:hypothetical protein